MVRLYGMSVVGLPDPMEHPEMMKDFSLERKEKIKRFKQPESRRQSLGAGLLLNHVLHSHGFHMDDVTYAVHGKPQIDGFHFNMSHSGDYIICAVSENSVGCDVEKVSDLPQNIAERYFTSKEVAYLNQLGDAEKVNEFYRIWTMKESYLKMTGEGLQFGMNRCAFRIGTVVEVYQDDEKQDCHMKEYRLNGYKVTVCAKEDIFNENIEFINIMEK